MPHLDEKYMRLAIRLAQRGIGLTSPNPTVGAVIVKRGNVIGRGWHKAAGLPHAEIEAINDAIQRGYKTTGATLYVTLEPCSTYGRTPPCTEAIIKAGIKRVVVGATDPNPRHRGRGFEILRQAGIEVVKGILEKECTELNPGFNHWIVHGTPFITVKAAMSLDGKIATPSGESKWITSEVSREFAVKMRATHDAVLVGINTVLADDPSLTVRVGGRPRNHQPWRIVLDSLARIPLTAKLVSDEFVHRTLVIVSPRAPKERVAQLANRVTVLTIPERVLDKMGEGESPRLDLHELVRELGKRQITSVLVEGGGEVNSSFIFQGLAHRVAFFYAPIIIGGRDAIPGVGGIGAVRIGESIKLTDVKWRRLGPDLLFTARIMR